MRIRPFLLAAFLLVSLSSAAQAQTLGRVFSTPQERAYLDGLRRAQNTEQLQSQTQELRQEQSHDSELAAIQAPLPILFQMGGSVRRGDGSNSVWLNGVSVREEDLPSNARLEFSKGLGLLRIKTPTGEMTVRPGQTLNTSTGEVRESYELSAEQAAAINAEVARRELASRPVVAARGQSAAEEPAAADPTAQQTVIVRAIVESLRQLGTPPPAGDAP